MKNIQTSTIVMVVGMLLAGSLWAADEAQKVQDVLSDLHHANQMEIKMGSIAKEKGTSDQVRSYGEKLVKDHSDADQQVQQLAKKEGVTLVEPPTSGVLDRIAASKEQHEMDNLAKKTGSDFDKAFTAAMIDDHKRDINKLESASNSLKDGDVRDLIAKLLPTLEQHLEIAQQIQKNS